MGEFVEVLVEATGRREPVPAHWLDDEILGKGIRIVEPTDPPDIVVEAPQPPSEVQLVAGTEDDLPIIPAAREAVLAARAAAAEAKPPTEGNTHDEIDAFAEKAGIELGTAKTKAEKVAVIDDHLNPGSTESPDETPAAGEEEN